MKRSTSEQRGAAEFIHQQQEIRIRRKIMAKLDVCARAEIVAEHYNKHALTTQHLLMFLQTIRYKTPTESQRQFVTQALEQIQNSHADDLGLLLSWEGEQ